MFPFLGQKSMYKSYAAFLDSNIYQILQQINLIFKT